MPDRRQRDLHLRRRYGITQDQYDQMLEEQGGVCAMCQRTEGDRPLAVDHSHTTGQVRGLLCTGCNTKVAAYEHSEKRIRSYLARYDAVKATDVDLFQIDLEG